jgi:hypothetical protein
VLRWATVRTPLLLYGLAFVARTFVFLTFPDPAYPDSYYYVDVARAISAGHGLNIDFIWIFAEVGNRITANPTLPIPSNAHWLPLASFLQVPFITLLGPTPLASALPMLLIGSLAAPLTWQIGREAAAQPIVSIGAGVLAAVPAAGTVFMSQPENFAILQPLVAATIWLAARGLKGRSASFALAGFLAGLASVARNDGILLFGAVVLIWVLDRVRWWRRGAGSRAWTTGEIRPPVSVLAAFGSIALFLLVVGPWWARQILVFGSITPTSSAALWIRTYAEWNSITANSSPATFLAQGPGPIIASRIGGLTSAIGNFAVVICSIVLLPFLVIGAAVRRASLDFAPWFAYAAIVFAGATFIYPLHVPGGAFIHSAIGLAPHAYILALEGVLAAVAAIAGRRSTWNEGLASRVFMGAIVALTMATAVVFGIPTERAWDDLRQPRVALATELDRLAIPASDRLLSIDASGMKYWTGRPGIVTPDDPIETVEAVARAYDARWLVLERTSIARSLAPILAGGARPLWIGRPVFSVPSLDGGLPRLVLFPVCTTLDDGRCGS